MEIRIETLPPYTIAYIRHTGPYGPGSAQAMDALKTWARSHDLLGEDSVILGIPRDDPAVTAPADCRYDACLVTTGPLRDDAVRMGSLAGGRYAVFTIPHTPEAMQKASTDIFTELDAQGYRTDGARPVIERYAARLVQAHLCEICVPIAE